MFQTYTRFRLHPLCVQSDNRGGGRGRALVFERYTLLALHAEVVRPRPIMAPAYLYENATCTLRRYNTMIYGFRPEDEKTSRLAYKRAKELVTCETVLNGHKEMACSRPGVSYEHTRAEREVTRSSEEEEEEKKSLLSSSPSDRLISNNVCFSFSFLPIIYYYSFSPYNIFQSFVLRLVVVAPPACNRYKDRATVNTNWDDDE